MPKTKKFPHGTTNGYRNLGCRCELCRKANTVAHLKYMKEHPEQAEKARVRQAIARGADPNSRRPVPQHGEPSGIRLHKRQGTNLCRPCKALDKATKLVAEERHKARLRPHGTEAALRRHYQRGETPCRLCKNVYKVRPRG